MHHRQDAPAAFGHGGVGINHRLAAVELFHHRVEGRVSEPFVAVARHQADAVGAQRVEGVADFLQAAVDVGQRERSEDAEAARMIACQCGCVVVAFAREPARRIAVAEPHARRGDRRDGGRDPRLVHVVERLLHAPALQRRLVDAARDQLLVIGRRRDVVMNVDDAGRRRRLCKDPCRRNAQAERRDAAGKEIPPARRALRQHRRAADATARKSRLDHEVPPAFRARTTRRPRAAAASPHWCAR